MAQVKKVDYSFLEEEYRETETFKKDNKIKGNTKKIKSGVNKNVMFFLILFGVCCFFLLVKGVAINEQNYKLLTLKNELMEISKENEQLEVELESKVDLNFIERVAIEKLGMQYPDNKQITYIQLEKGDFTELKKDVALDDSRDDGVMASVKDGVMQVVGYLY